MADATPIHAPPPAAPKTQTKPPKADAPVVDFSELQAEAEKQGKKATVIHSEKAQPALRVDH